MTLHAAHQVTDAFPCGCFSAQAGGLRCGLRLLWAGLSLIGLCLIGGNPAQAAVAVTPLSEEVLTIGTTAEDAALSPLLQPRLIPENEWKRYCNRPNAFGLAVNTVQNHPNGAVGYVRDPAYLPIMPMTDTKPAPKTKSRSKKAPTTTAPVAPVVSSPYVPSPTVPSPTAPRVASPNAPTVATPYSSVAAPTGPVASPSVSSGAALSTPTAPTSPTVPANPASPSMAAQPAAQDGVMSSGRGIVADMAGNGINGAKGTSGTAANSAGTTTQNGRGVLNGPASSLVVPPPGISLTPNNGVGALTAPANTQ